MNSTSGTCSSPDHRILPGDLIVSRVNIRAWVTDEERGFDGTTIYAGTAVLVLAVWTVGGQLRLRVLHGDSMVLFSNRSAIALKNWFIASRPA